MYKVKHNWRNVECCRQVAVSRWSVVSAGLTDCYGHVQTTPRHRHDAAHLTSLVIRVLLNRQLHIGHSFDHRSTSTMSSIHPDSLIIYLP